ncbi:TonB-dependent receptor domain-containing protein [Brevundimonas sp.]|uniref:TonB-dependent receptor n=1 Tax=Brevundimonas sp. TaxID=1871086 RepID=UPI00289AFCCF|nr:TonB-dependent receptor [Brevundimonas sp.]
MDVKTGISCGALAWALISFADPAAAQTGPETEVVTGVDEVVVTARRRDEAPISVPVSVTVLGSEQLRTLAVDSLQDLRAVTPGISVGEVSGGVGGTVSLRGVGTTAGSNPTFEQTVAINIDGVQLSRGGAVRVGQIDMEKIEVLRGPQALFFGKNSPAGVISITTADPGRSFEVETRAGYEFNAKERQLEAVVSGPITETLGGRLVVYGADMDGWRDNIAGQAAEAANAIRPGSVTGATSGGPQQTFFFTRGTLKWEPTDRFDARLKLSYAKNDGIGYNQAGGFQRIYCPNGAPQLAPQATVLNGGVPNVALEKALSVDNCRPDATYANGNINPAFLVGSPEGFTDPSGAGDYSQQLHSLELNYRPSEWLKLTSVTGWAKNEDFRVDTYAVAPSDAAAANDFSGNTGYTQFTQEVRVSSDLPGAFNFLAGAFYESSELETYTRAIAAGSPKFLHNIDGKTQSVFGQVLWDVASTVELAGGLRWSKESKDFAVSREGVPQPVSPASADFKNTSPEVTLTWRPTDRLTLYGAYKEGFKSGGFAAATNTGPAFAKPLNALYLPEAAQGFEGGVKALLFDGALRLNLAAYDYDYTNLQVNSLDNSSGVPVIRVNNAGAATVRGLEADFTLRLPQVQGLTIRGAANYNDAKYTDFLATCYIGQTIADGCNLLLNPSTGRYTGQQLAGERLVNAPEWTGSLGAAYSGPTAIDGVDWGMNIDTLYKSEYNPHPELHPGALQNDVAFLNAGVRVFSADRTWEVALIGRNLTEEFRVDVASNVPQTGLAARTGTALTGGLADLSGNVNRGREIMLQVTFRPF